MHGPALAPEVHREIANLQRRDGLVHARTTRRGSRASRRPSPTKLMARTVRKIAAPGNTVIHQLSSVVPMALVSRLPQLAVGGWIPKPRNDSVLSTRIASATTSVAFTMMGPRQLGNTWRRMMRVFDAPIARDASTNSRSRNDRVAPRTIRAI